MTNTEFNQAPETLMVSERAPLLKRLSLEGKVLAKLCLPIVVIQLLQMGVVVLDTVMAGRYSAIDLAGVAIGGAIWIPTFLFLVGTLSSLTPTIAQLHGAKRLGPIGLYVYQGIWLSLLLAVPVMIAAQFTGPLLRIFAVDEHILPIAEQYLAIVVLGLPAVLAFNTFRFFSEGLSLTRPAAYASLIGLLVNFPLNYVMIFGKWGFPELGGIGCAWASVISYWAMLIFMLTWVALRKEYRVYHIFQKIIGLKRKETTELLKIGLPIGGAHFIEASFFCVIAILLSSLGPTVVASHQIALNVSALVYMIPLSISMALTIRVGFLVGAKQGHEARFMAFLGLSFAVLFSLFNAVLLYAFRFPLAELYNSSADVIELTASLLTFAAIFQLSDGLQVSAAGALRGYKDTRMPMLIMMVSFWVISLPIGYMLSLTDIFGPPRYARGFWLGLVIGLGITSILLIYRLHQFSSRVITQLEGKDHERNP